MKIVIVNGSYRKNGATAQILNEMYEQLLKYKDVEVEMVHVADLELNYCVGCNGKSLLPGYFRKTYLYAAKAKTFYHIPSGH